MECIGVSLKSPNIFLPKTKSQLHGILPTPGSSAGSIVVTTVVPYYRRLYNRDVGSCRFNSGTLLSAILRNCTTGGERGGQGGQLHAGGATSSVARGAAIRDRKSVV